jgi:hypothetical protein
VSITAATFLFPPSSSSSLFSTDGVGVRRHVSMPGCWPSSRSTAASCSCGALGPPMPPGLPTPCEDHLCSLAIEPSALCKSCCAPPYRLVTCPWLPGGRAERTRRGRACAMHGFGPRTSGELHARPLASRAARDAAAARRVHGALLTRARRRRACAQMLSRAPTRAFCCRWEA